MIYLTSEVSDIGELVSDNRCWDCGQIFNKKKPYNGHYNTCETGIKEEEWIEHGLTLKEVFLGYELRFDEDGRPYLYDLNEDELG